MGLARFEFYEDGAGDWRWRLIAGNGEKTDASEGYSTESNAKRGAKDLAENAAEAALGIEVAEERNDEEEEPDGAE